MKRADLLPARRFPYLSRVLCWRNDIGLCVMWPRTVWEVWFYLDRSMILAEDFEYWLRIASRFRIARCPGGALLYVRSADGQAGSNVYYEKQHVATVRLLKWAAEAYDPSGRLQLRKVPATKRYRWRGGIPRERLLRKGPDYAYSFLASVADPVSEFGGWVRIFALEGLC